MIRQLASLAPGFVLIVLLAVAPPVPGKAALKVTNPSPFTVSGVGFRPYERVTIVLQFGERYLRVITTNRAGTFVVRFAALSARNCPAYIIRATGSKGSKAYLRSLQECMPLGPPP